MVGADRANLGAKVFFIWGSLCFLCLVYAYVLIPETKGLSLEQVDRMLEETTPRTSAKWKPTTTFASEMGLKDGRLDEKVIEDVKRKGSIH
jgi:SP family sugar:H+ symporter-like MFS transporter